MQGSLGDLHPCQTAEPACLNRSTLLWLYAPGVLTHVLVLLLLGLRARACLRTWTAASFPAKNIANIPGNEERESLLEKCPVLASVQIFCQKLTSDTETLRPFKCSTIVYATIKHNSSREKWVCFWLLWVYRGLSYRLWSSLLCAFEERGMCYVGRAQWDSESLAASYNTHAMQFSLGMVI